MMERDELATLVDPRLLPPARSWPPASPAAPVIDLDRIAGALVGGALGDVLGGPNESKGPRGRISIEQVDPRRARVSDDTQLTIELAGNLVANGGSFDPAAFAGQLVDWLSRAVGIGRATREAVVRLRDGEPWHTAGTPSAGNGAAMRVAPVGLVHAGDLDRLRLEAAVSALPTHHDPTAAASAVAMAWATAYCASVADPETLDPATFLHEIDSILSDVHDPGIEPRQPGASPLVTMRWAIGVLGDVLDLDPEDYFARFWSGALVTESLPAALWCVLRSPGDPVEAIRPAAELARDADTVAAMAGTLVGGLHGRSGLPDRLVDVVPVDVVAELDDLAGALAGLPGGGD